MICKIAEMRAARIKMSPPPAQRAPRESVEPRPELEFPEYTSHCEAWSAATTPGEADEITPGGLRPSRLVASRLSVSMLPPVATRNPPPSRSVKLALRQYVFAAVTAGVAALLLAAGVHKLQMGTPAMQMTASADASLVAGGDRWNELPTDVVIS